MAANFCRHAMGFKSEPLACLRISEVKERAWVCLMKKMVGEGVGYLFVPISSASSFSGAAIPNSISVKPESSGKGETDRLLRNTPWKSQPLQSWCFQKWQCKEWNDPRANSVNAPRGWYPMMSGYARAGRELGWQQLRLSGSRGSAEHLGPALTQFHRKK